MKSEKGDDTGTAVLTGRKVERLRTVIGISVIGKQKCSENGNCNAIKTGTGIQ